MSPEVQVTLNSLAVVLWLFGFVCGGFVVLVITDMKNAEKKQ